MSIEVKAARIMPTVTVYVPADLHELMKRHPGMNKSRAFATGVRTMIARADRCRCDACSHHLARTAAGGAVQQAVKNGRLEVQPCETCASTEKIEAHHDNYAQPLDVRWLCRQHHREWHMEHGRAPNGGTILPDRRRRKAKPRPKPQEEQG